MTQNQFTDWRGLCEELVETLDGWHQAVFETGVGWVRPDETYLLDRARAALAAEPVGEGPTGDAAVEAAAELIYNQAMKWAATQPIPSDHINIPAWQQGGNSDAQEVARRTARAALAAKPLVKGPTDEELLGVAAQTIEPYDEIRLDEYEPENNCAIEVYGSELIAFARAVLARWGHPAPASTGDCPAPAEGDVAELVAWSRGANWDGKRQSLATRAADLLEQRQSAPPAKVPATGLAAELVAWLNDHAINCEELGRADWAERCRVIADLLERQAAPVPVAVSERLPGTEDCDAEGRCWLFSKVEKEWRLIDAGNPGVPHLKYCFSHWLPATALPLPSGEVE